MKYLVAFPNTSIEKKFDKILAKLPSKKLQKDILTALENLTFEPRPFGEPKIKPPVIVHHFTAQYRVKIGSYRILYDVDDKKQVVLILDLRKRNERTYN